MQFDFPVKHRVAIVFLCLSLGLAGLYAAWRMPSAIFPQTDFPRVVILIDNGVMPSNEMMATITRPVEESMKDIPGVENVRSRTGRGSAEVNVFFNWHTDMTQAELYVRSKLAVVQKTLPATSNYTVSRLTFSAFPVMGLSLTGNTQDVTQLWETARYTIQPKILRIQNVAKVGVLGGRVPEYHIVVDPLKLQALQLGITQVAELVAKSNVIAPAGMLEEDYSLYLTVTDGRVHTLQELENLVILSSAAHPAAAASPNHLLRIKDIARVERNQEPAFYEVTADGKNAVLMNIYSQPDGSTLEIARQVKAELTRLNQTLPPGMHIQFFYDQSELVAESMQSVWEAMLAGLILSVVILYLFLRNWGSTLVAALVIPLTVSFAMLGLYVAGLGFNLMTLGGIAAAIGLVIDDAIVVVEAMHVKWQQGESRASAIRNSLSEIFRPLLASTLTPVVVFVPLAFLDGVPGVFFKSLAFTMVVSLLTSMLLALTFIPALSSWLSAKQRSRAGQQAVLAIDASDQQHAHVLWPKLRQRYVMVLGQALAKPRWIVLSSAAVLGLSACLYTQLETEFLPFMDEGGFVLDYHAPWGTSLTETNRQLLVAEQILKTVPELEGYSRRTGARLALGISQAHNGDFLVKLKAHRTRSTDAVIADVRQQLHRAVPGIHWEFAGILGDLIGDLTWSPKPVELKLFSTDVAWLQHIAPSVQAKLDKIAGIVDSFDGLESTGSTLHVKVRAQDAARFGMTSNDIQQAVSTAMLGQKASYLLEGDRVVHIRVRMPHAMTAQMDRLMQLPLRAADGRTVKLLQVADLERVSGEMEMHREDMRQLVAVSARLEQRDLGSAIAEIKRTFAQDPLLANANWELGGLYAQQYQSFMNLMLVLLAALFLVFAILLIAFRTFQAPLAILAGAILAMSGTVLAWTLTGTSVNIVSLLGAIIGVGVVAKNGILMLDAVHKFKHAGLDLKAALLASGVSRLRPVLMTSLAAALGLLPLAYGVGAGSDMLKPMAIAVIGALVCSVLLSLIATPVFYYWMHARTQHNQQEPTVA